MTRLTLRFRPTLFIVRLALLATIALWASLGASAHAQTIGVWRQTGSLSAAGAPDSATRLTDGRVLAIEGSRAEIYDPKKGTWAVTGSLGTDRTTHEATLLGDGRVLVAGGSQGGTVLLSSAEIFDPARRRWSPTGSMSAPRAGHSAITLGSGQVLVAAGSGGGGSLPTSTEIFNPVTGKWSLAGSMSVGRFLHTATLLGDGRVLVAGGTDNVVSFSSAEIFDPATGRWSVTGSMLTPRSSATATRLTDGRVLVAGGNNGGTLLTSAEIYDPTTGLWTATGSMTGRRGEHAAALLADGRVLVSGGTSGLTGAFGTVVVLRTAELYNPATGTWSAAGDMNDVRRLHPAVLLTSGLVLVTGGFDGSRAELYDIRAGILAGTVTDASSRTPISSASIQVTGPDQLTVQTGADGRYSVGLRIGTYAVTARAFGYFEQTASGVVIAQEQTTVHNVALVPIARRTVSGHVRDSGGAALFNATVTLLGTPIPPTTTDVNGFYSFASVPEGSYTVRAGAAGCNEPLERPLTVAGGPATLDFTLATRADSFGNTCRHTVPAYIEATDIVSLTNTDEGNGTVTLPFAFPFYGRTHTTAFIWADGVVNFVWPGGRPNSAIPSTAAPNAAIYAFWDDLFVCSFCTPASTVRTRSLGTAPDRRFVIEWRDVYIKPSSEGKRLDVEVVLFENGQILLQYRNIDSPDARERGSSATVGIENQDGTVALQYSFDEPSLSDAAAILFAPTTAPPPPPPPPNASITVIFPNGGEVLPKNVFTNIQWTAANLTGNVTIQLSRDGGASWTQIVTNMPADAGAFQWAPPGPATTQALIRIISMDHPTVQDTSDGVFTISD